MKNKSVLGTLKFIFFTVILFVLTFSAVVVTILNIYVPTYKARINGKLVGYYTDEEEFEEVYAALTQEKATNGLEVKTYLEADPDFEMSYVRRSSIEKQNLYDELRDKVKAEYTLYNVVVKGKKEMIFTTKVAANDYAKSLKKAIGKVKIEVVAEKEDGLKNITEMAKAKEIYKSLVSRYKTTYDVYKYEPVSYSFNKTVAGGVKPTTWKLFSQHAHGGHIALDLANDVGTAIYAYKAGVVEFRKYSGAYGNLIIIDHGDGVETYYAHLSGWNVVEGQTVKTGQKIARMGNTGRSTGPHLHFEIRVNGQRINPEPYIK